MPKKTRAEKIAASYRNKLKLLQEQISFPSSTVVEVKKPSIPLEKDTTLKKYFLEDFTKSLLLIVFIISLEIVFFFVSIKRY